MRHLESQHGRALVQWWGHACGRWQLEPDDLFHVPNERSNKAQAMRLKLEGVRPGIPDYLLTVPVANWSGLWIELKSPTGSATGTQKTQLVRLNRRGYLAVVCRGWHEARQLIESYLEGYE